LQPLYSRPFHPHFNKRTFSKERDTAQSGVADRSGARALIPESWDTMSATLGGGLKVASHPGEVTQLLIELRAGNRDAEEKLISLVYAELRRLAAHYLRGERGDHTLQPTALVHEAYIRMTKLNNLDWRGRSHFFATAAIVMRRILVDHARTRQANKRGAFRDAISLDDALVVSHARSPQLIALDEALDRLAKLDARKSRIVELRYFGGLSEEEIGAVLEISERTVKREWRTAKAWLHNEINRR
jgi:RNA polymerase sigma-70 factor (ECF subfamily)